MADPKPLGQLELASRVLDLFDLSPVPLGDVVVDDDTMLDEWFIKARTITFNPGARLIFSRQALLNRTNMFIVAREITSKDVGAPGAIAYEAPEAGDVPPEPGQAPAGRRGDDDGDNGGAGQAGGGREVTAAPGCSAPNLTIVVLSVPGPGPRVDFGGRRGTGGAGGTVTIIAPSDLLPDLARKFGVQVSGGTGGDPGRAGPDGDAGPRGPGGVDGSFFVGAIAEETFERIYEDG